MRMVKSMTDKVPAVSDDVVKEVVKQRRPKKSEAMAPHVNPGDNRKYLHHARQLMGLKRPDMTDKQAVLDRINYYFDLCETNDMKPSVEGMALAFGAERKTLYRWANGIESSQIPSEVRNILQVAYTTLNSLMVEYMQNGKINPVSGIFLMKNNMGYADQTEIVVTPNNPLGAEQSAEDLQKRITDGVVVEVPEE